MGRRCCVPSCSSTSRLPEHHGVTYHSFPLDSTIRTIWLRNCRLSADKQITKSVLVCSRHFRRIDFQPQRNGKYLLKQRVFPTVFAWGKIDPEQVLKDQEELQATGTVSSSLGDFLPLDKNLEDATKASVEAKVAQIMAETAELNAAAGLKSNDSTDSGSAGVRYEPVTNFASAARLEAQDFDGLWHPARIVEVDNEDREVLIKFERNSKNKSVLAGTEEWIPMNSTRLRQKVSTRPIPVFEMEEKCLARWSGPRKFPGTVKRILGNDTYEVLFDDGFVKNVRAVHMCKVIEAIAVTTSTLDASESFSPQASSSVQITAAISPAPHQGATIEAVVPSAKKRGVSNTRKDWPLLDLSKLDLASLNLPEIPRDGEWTCHWVNDQPIGKEGFLLVGEHRKPTVIVEDWRLPQGWVKHMYQRSNVLGKWDVILVSPSGKRFRSKSDLKVFLEEQGLVYNPDIYDFSIHRRRAKDINAYAFTPEYQPQQPYKPKTVDTSFDLSTNSETILNTPLPEPTLSTSQYMETPVATPLPPIELMTPATPSPQPILASSLPPAPSPVLAPETAPATALLLDQSQLGSLVSADPKPVCDSGACEPESNTKLDPGFTYIGGLKVQIIDNLFRCPKDDCSKTFRKENHLQIHVKHYHSDLKKLLGACPKMIELAKKRTHPVSGDAPPDPQPKNQIPNQEFFSKVYQQDILQHSRARRRSNHSQSESVSQEAIAKTESQDAAKTKAESSAASIKSDLISPKKENASIAPSSELANNVSLDSSAFNGITTSTPHLSQRGPRRTFGSRKSNRQRTTRRYLTAKATRAIKRTPVAINTANDNFGVADLEETRHSFNVTPDPKSIGESRKRKAHAAASTVPAALAPLSSDSPFTADSGSSSFQPLTEAVDPGSLMAQQQAQQQYIKENGELIKIVRMRQEEIINCVCQFGEEDGLMIQCELCLCWQHGACHGIEKESDVPEKYVCYICRNPERVRESMRYKHDQDWLYEGILPVANYHTKNPNLQKRFDILKKSHTLAGNLVETKNFMHSLNVKMNIASNRLHPKLYLWAKKWESDENVVNKSPEVDADGKSKLCSPAKKAKAESDEAKPAIVPNIPQPEAPIDPVECQQRLLAHIKVQQDLVMNRLTGIEAEIDELEAQDDLPDLKDADAGVTKDVLSTFIKELELMYELAKINQYENASREGQEQTSFSAAN